MFELDNLKYLKYVPSILIGFCIYIFIMSVIIFLLYFNITDIKSIVEAMKQCVV